MSESNGSVIEMRGVNVRYGKLTALDNLSLAVSRGSVYALLGRNGAGKSSLVRCLLGQQKPNSGEVSVFGEKIWHKRATLMDRIGVVAEDPDAPPEMTSLEILRFCSKLYRKWDGESALARLKRIEAPLKVPFGRLSKGQKRQVLLAMALASSPELLVLDDPTLGLDVVARKELFEELISDLADRGTTVIVTTHDLPGIESIADRVGILKHGQLVLDENLETLKWRFRRIRYASAPAAVEAPQFEHLQAVGVRRWGGGIEAVVSNYDDVSLERFRTTTGIRDVEVTPLSLEEIFIALSGDEKGEAS